MWDQISVIDITRNYCSHTSKRKKGKKTYNCGWDQFKNIIKFDITEYYKIQCI